MSRRTQVGEALACEPYSPLKKILVKYEITFSLAAHVKGDHKCRKQGPSVLSGAQQLWEPPPNGTPPNKMQHPQPHPQPHPRERAGRTPASQCDSPGGPLRRTDVTKSSIRPSKTAVASSRAKQATRRRPSSWFIPVRQQRQRQPPTCDDDAAVGLSLHSGVARSVGATRRRR